MGGCPVCSQWGFSCHSLKGLHKLKLKEQLLGILESKFFIAIFADCTFIVSTLCFVLSILLMLKVNLVFHRTLGRMQECYQAVFPGQPPIVKKGHIEPIDITVASRGSNKKVPISFSSLAISG